MYSSVPSPPFSPGHASTAGPVSPTSPSRSGRLRGLSYLRSYTHTHLLSRESHSSSSSNQQNQQRPTTLARATSYPSPAASQTARASAALDAQNNAQDRTSLSPHQLTTEEFQPFSQDNLGSSGGAVSNASGRRGSASSAQGITTTNSSDTLPNNQPATASESNSAGRSRSETVGAEPQQVERSGSIQTQSEARAEEGTSSTMPNQLPSIRFCAHQDPRALRPSLVFSPMTRILPSGSEVIRVGRYSERENHPPQVANTPSAAPVGFKSKVVSRRHCEFYYSRGSWFIKDVKSSSGTFLNHIRLSPPGTESKPYPVSDGDIVQLGIDFKGGEEMIFRCVKIRIELNKGHPTGPSNFNVTSHKRLRELNSLGTPTTSSQDCAICLGPIAPCQSLFVAPCSHTWHYKCIRIIINGPNWPHFMCPNCRCVADLEAELEDPYAHGDWEQLNEEEGPARDSDNAEQSATVLESRREQDHNETTLLQQPAAAISNHARSAQNGKAREAGENSDSSQGVDEITADLGRMNTNDSLQQSDLDPAEIMGASNSTVPAVNIINRKLVSRNHEQPESRTVRSMARTPSPNGLGSSLSTGVNVVEGPMTPRNDVGPFVFDGSGGRGGEMRLGTPTLNLNAAADSD